jgi:CheY-like chemotaxis protein/anti-sigma regulatory factor (Ser/Thr protein kinase)
LLDLSRLDVGAVTVEPRDFALHDLLSRLAAQFEPMARAQGLRLSLVSTSTWVRSDPVLLERVLLNLLSNALRFTPRGRVLIGCRRRAEAIEVVVADTGIGIAAGHLPQVFQEFYRAGPPRGGMDGGLGLGLAIVQRIGRLLDHLITIDSVAGKGTVVRVRVPRALPQARSVSPAVALVDSLKARRVLVVDDDASTREAMRGMLAAWQCEVVTAVGLEDALVHARERTPEVVLCDLALADGHDGVEVVERLRRACGPQLRCAFITGESSPGLVAQARATRHPIVFKPTAPAKLRALLEHLVSSQA